MMVMIRVKIENSETMDVNFHEEHRRLLCYLENFNCQNVLRPLFNPLN